MILDNDKKVCLGGDKEIQLTKIEYKLLSVLFENEGRIMSRKEIASLVWENGVSLRTVDAVVSRLRKKIGDTHITTRHGFGYGLNC